MDQSSPAPAATPRTIRRLDYQPPEFRVTHLALDFDLEPNATIVKATLKLERAGSGKAPLVLDGRRVELLSVALDGKPLAPGDYAVDSEHLTIPKVGAKAVIDIVTRIDPSANTSLDGLYRSSGNFCTQCEPEGFRKITYYLDRPDVMAPMTVRMAADKAACPVLLSNGNPIVQGDLPNGRHYAVWDDPFPKSSYLFALVAGDLKHISDSFTTGSGRTVTLGIYAAPSDLDKLDHAMRSLKASMAWDERTYGREYQLDVFNIVAVGDFNMGAMENTGLNIFNTKYVLASPDTATDFDYAGVEGVIGHEYFHNWSGNRVTCRDWFQLSLKEGFTVFRDQQFSADMSGEAIKRIGEVDRLRRAQFPEDSGPMAHPIRPDSYIEINNFYTPTVYEKGAEIIRMLRTLLGPDRFRAGTDLYFSRHDGQAVTCEDFVKALEDASGVDLGQFRVWYSQAGTPTLAVSGNYDAAAKRYSLTVSQSTAPTPGQLEKAPLHIPIRVSLIGADGKPLPLDAGGETERVLELKVPSARFDFDNIPAKPIPSLLRGFSAPVRLVTDLGGPELAFLIAHDNDPVARWDAAQELGIRAMLAGAGQGAAPDADTLADLLTDALGAMLKDPALDPGLGAMMLMLPDAAGLAEYRTPVDVDALSTAAKAIRVALAQRLRTTLLDVYAKTGGGAEDDLSAQAVGRRALHNATLRLLMAAPDAETVALADKQFHAAQGMTLRIGALSALADTDGPERAAALTAFYERHKGNALTIDKWFSVQARADRPQTLEDVRVLMRHPDFTTGNPNRLRSLIGAFADGNFTRFHDPAGNGYRLLADIVAHLDTTNPQVGARMLGPIRQWRRFADPQRSQMEAALKELAGKVKSRDIFEVVSKSLAT
ncbi:MAG TPA: aminopeptidase N [Alphaproteobacteria bacterium]|nr:aminopeptidase N [Alphaproteobacteria bacterium]